MKNKITIIALLLCFGTNLHCQNNLLRKIKRMQNKHELLIKKKINIYKGKDATKLYANILFIPFLYLNNIELTQEVILSNSLKDTVMVALKEKPTIDNLKLTPNFPYHAIVYNKSLNILIDNYDYLCVSPNNSECLLKYYSELKADLLFYIWGRNEYFVLIDNKIWMLKYDSETKTFTKIEL